jgi:hypothetical protein
MSGVQLAPTSPPADSVGGTVCLVPLERLRTTFAALRSGGSTSRPDELAALPLRVVPTADGSLEVLDGFKRLASWRATSVATVPVVVEQAATAVECKRRLLLANAPRRTVTALDEARVVCSLVNDDGMTPKAVERLLHRKTAWVACRIALGTRLSSQSAEWVARGRMGPTLAHALTTLAHKDQDAPRIAPRHRARAAARTLPPDPARPTVLRVARQPRARRVPAPRCAPPKRTRRARHHRAGPRSRGPATGRGGLP